MLLDALSPNFAYAQIAAGDKRVATEYLTYDAAAGNGRIRGYFARPAGLSGKAPGVLVVHENRGLNPHIEDIARRLALANFVAFAPDALTPLGGYPGDEDKARALFPKLDQAKSREDFVAGAKFLQQHASCTGRIGAVGFCYGGAIVNMLATRLPDLGAAVPFYGTQPAADSVSSIKAPLLIHYAETDERVNAGWPAYEAALKANKVRYESHFYPGTQHGFNTPPPPRCAAAAARLAWQRTIDFFNRQLRG
jgi:carboxymethylenebutenolidase